MWPRKCSVTSPSSNHMTDLSPRFVPGPRNLQIKHWRVPSFFKRTIPQTSSPASSPRPPENLAEHCDGHPSAQSSQWPAMAEKGTARLRHTWTPDTQPEPPGADKHHLLLGPHPQGPQTGGKWTEPASQSSTGNLHPLSERRHQNGCKEPYRMVQQKEIASLQEALTAAGHQGQLENAIRHDLERELFHTKSLLKTAYVELNERGNRAKALEGHLHADRTEVQTLTQPFC